MRIAPLPILALTAAAVVVAPSGALGQGVHYTSTTRMEFAGAMGTLMGAFGHDEPQESQTWMQDARIRSDDGSTSTVFDLADGSYLFIDHESRTWFRTTFAEMMAAAEEAAAQATGAVSAEERPSNPEEAETAEEPGLEAEFSFDLDRTGERKTVGGYEAERVVLTMEVEFQAESEEGQMQEAGDMVMINDMWISPDFPTAASMMTDEDQLAWMEDMRTSGTETYAQIMAANPQVGTALERMQEEMEGLDGTALESRAYVLMVAPGADFDRDAVLALNDQPLSEGLGSVMGDAAGSAARAAAADAARSAAGRLGGLFGRNRDEEKEEEPAPPAWSVLTRVTTLVTTIEPGPFPPAVFEPDPGYTERRPDWMGGGD